MALHCPHCSGQVKPAGIGVLALRRCDKCGCGWSNDGHQVESCGKGTEHIVAVKS
jgi:hypothetical protein